MIKKWLLGRLRGEKCCYRVEILPFQMEVMFGSRNYPFSGGYTLGYDIVQMALENPTMSVENWTNLNSEKLLEMSGYK